MPWVQSARHTAAAVAFASLVLAASAAVSAADPLSGLNGSWSGSGQFRLENGRAESIRCSANYAPRGGASLGLALRCASASNKIELRANLVARGNRVSGTWEERSYNASGGVSGVSSGNSLRLNINGGLSGSMVVTTTGGSQSISVRTDSSALLGVNINLRRN